MFPLRSGLLDLSLLLFLPTGGSAGVALLPDGSAHINTAVNSGVY